VIQSSKSLFHSYFSHPLFAPAFLQDMIVPLRDAATPLPDVASILHDVNRILHDVSNFELG
jgi:hypothetical protein